MEIPRSSARFLVPCALSAFALLLACPVGAQLPESPAPRSLALSFPAHSQQPASSATNSASVRLTLQDAIVLARKNDPAYHSAVTAAGIAAADRSIARSALLPSGDFTTSDLYTQPNSSSFGVKFIANNAPHEYVSMGNVHEQVDLASIAAYRSSAAQAALARAQAEIAARGLVVIVVQNYFNVAAATEKLAIAKRAAVEGDHFLKLTQDREQGGEAAHADVIKAELQSRDRHRQSAEAQLALLNARLDLAVLLFPDFNNDFELADDLHASVPLPPRPEFEAQAAHENPEIRAALAAIQAANHEVTAARAEYLPSFTFDYWYGIDAERYATYTPATPPDTGKISNLGSAALASMTLPLWNWGATQSRVKQAQLRREQSKLELSYSQRKLLAEMRSLYSEAETALDELAGLQRSAQLAADSLRLTLLRYKDGEATVLEVVDAQTTFATANAGYQDGAVRYRVALANLQTLTGVLATP